MMKFGRIFIAFICAAMAMGTTPALAKWHMASSAHFVVYADDSPADILRFAGQLERYHEAMDYVSAGEFPTPSPSNRVTIYVVKNEVEVRRLAGVNASKWLMGFYIPRAGGSMAIIPKVDAARGQINDSMLTLLHEYAHHFFIGTSSVALPRWVTEGSAEFFASAKFESNGGISIGRPAIHRGAELFYASDVTATDLLDPESYEKRKKNNDYDAYYGKSWLLFHYLRFDEKRKGQLSIYIQLLAKGVPVVEAGQKAFGDFKVLEKELDIYLKSSRMTYYNLAPETVPIGEVTVRPLRDGEAAIMPVVIRSKSGVNEETAPAVLVDARKIAAQFPADPAVLAALAEAEYDAGNDKEAVAAADQALAIDPNQVNAYVQKGYALFRIAETADDYVTTYKEARRVFIALNKIENDHPIPLIYYYRSFVTQGIVPTPLAIQALEQAVGLAPFDRGLRVTLVQQYLSDSRFADARVHLLLLASDPHAGDLATYAKDLIAKIDSGEISTKDALGIPGKEET